MSEKASPGFDLAAFKALLDDSMAPIKAELDSLKVQVAEQERRASKFVPMQGRVNPSGMPRSPQEHFASMASTRPGETSTESARSLLTTQNGKRMDQSDLAGILQSFGPAFEKGDQVRINPDAQRLGWAEGKTWGPLLAKDRKNPDGYGVVREIAPFSHRGWMYRVKVEGHTPERGMVFDQHELLGA